MFIDTSLETVLEELPVPTKILKKEPSPQPETSKKLSFVNNQRL